MNLEKMAAIMKEGYVCDRCLGRQYAQLLTGTDNLKRGKAVRFVLAMKADSGEEMGIHPSNFHGFEFHSRKVKAEKPGKCIVCGGIFKGLKKKVNEIEKAVAGYDFKTVLIGTILPDDLLLKEQEVWGKVGVEFCEPLKSEVNRELGKAVAERLGKDVDKKAPDVNVVYDFKEKRPVVNVRPVFIYGKYRKLVRGIPQTEWKNKVFETSVQGVIEKPLLKALKGEKSSFHGAGREDIDARCLGWRPFVIEIKEPRKRAMKLAKAGEAIKKSKMVEVKGLRMADRMDIRDAKSARYDKKYRLRVEFESKIEGIERVMELKGAQVAQKTPTRVMRRRADKTRKRLIKDITYKVLGQNKLEMTVTTEAGLYVKELVSGDGGRTQPNVSELINNKVKNIELDVIRIYSD
jgi:tRNA pseudouridine synthase 10